MTRYQREKFMRAELEHPHPNVPEDILESISRYIVDGVPPGQFLRAVLENNLTEAVCRADQDNLAALGGIVLFAYNHLPATCWGKPEKVAEWLAMCAQEREAPQ